MLSSVSLYGGKDQCSKIFLISFHQVKLQFALNNHGNVTAAQLTTYADILKRCNEVIKRLC